MTWARSRRRLVGRALVRGAFFGRALLGRALVGEAFVGRAVVNKALVNKALVLLAVISSPALTSCHNGDKIESFAVLKGISFTDEEGDSLHPSFLEGRVVLMNFMFTSCPAVCPRLTKLLVDTRATLPKAVLPRVQFLSVTVDPERDSTSELKKFAKKTSADVPGWSFVRTTDDALHGLSERLTVFDPGSARIPAAHSTSIYLFNDKGRPVQRYDGTTTSAHRLAREVRSLLSQEATPP